MGRGAVARASDPADQAEDVEGARNVSMRGDAKASTPPARRGCDYGGMSEPTDPTPDWLRDLQQTLSKTSAPSPFAELTRIVHQVRGPVLEFVDRLRALDVIDIHRKLVAHTERIAALPEKLRAALAGEVVLHPELSLSDVASLDEAYEEGGVAAAVAMARQLLENLLASAQFRKELEDRWTASGRWPVMREVLVAYDAELYYVAIPPALAQVEGVIANFFDLKGLKYPELQKRVAELHEVGDLFAPLVDDFLKQLLAEFDHRAPVLLLNRHAVQHGGDRAYGTKPNAVTAIMWADYALLLTIEARARREGRTSDGED
jgi:hypothetical protein